MVNSLVKCVDLSQLTQVSWVVLQYVVIHLFEFKHAFDFTVLTFPFAVSHAQLKHVVGEGVAIGWVKLHPVEGVQRF